MRLTDISITVKVNPQHIAKGSKKSAKTCPIALAIKDILLPDDLIIKVLRSSVQIWPKRGRKGLYGKLPDSAIEFNYCFDKGLEVQPFQFRIDLRV